MKITDVRVRLSKKEDAILKGVASITIDDCFVVHDIKVLKGDNELYIGMPSKKVPDATLGKDVYKDIAHAINTATREEIKKAVLSAYDAELKKVSE